VLIQTAYAWVEPETHAEARALADSAAIHNGARLRPWVAENARRMLPAILEARGPSMDAFLIHDSHLHVYRVSLATMYYLGGQRPGSEIGVAQLKQALPSFDPFHDGWAVIDPRGLRGLVRDNVRVIWIHHDPAPQDTARGTSNDPSTDKMNRRAALAENLARQYHPEMFDSDRAPGAVALVLDSHEQLLAHAVGAGPARPTNRARGRVYASEACLDGLTRILPQYRGALWAQTGCSIDPQTKAVVYWGQLTQ
jgi:hypothetical protein